MTVCSNHSCREKIVFESRNCPLCESEADVEKLKEQLAEAQSEIRSLENEVSALQGT